MKIKYECGCEYDFWVFEYEEGKRHIQYVEDDGHSFELCNQHNWELTK